MSASATDRPSPAVLPEVDRLRDHLHDVGFFATRLLIRASEAPAVRAANQADRLRRDRSRLTEPQPTASHIDEEGLVNAGDPVPPSLQETLPEAVRADLDGFWPATDGVYAGLRDLPAEVRGCLDDIGGGHWVERVQHAMDTITGWAGCSRPQRGSSPDARKFVDCVQLADLSEPLGKLAEFEKHLQATRGSKVTDENTQNRTRQSDTKSDIYF